MYCKHDIIQCMHPHIQVNMLAIYTCILVVLILEQEIFLMERAFLHKRIPWLLHVLDNYCTVAIFPSRLCAAPTSTITHQHRIAQYLHTWNGTCTLTLTYGWAPLTLLHPHHVITYSNESPSGNKTSLQKNIYKNPISLSWNC